MTLHGAGVTTKLYFAIFAAFKESMTLNLAQRSFTVIHFGGNRKPVYDFIVVNTGSSFRSIFNRIGDIADFIRRNARANCVSKYVSVWVPTHA